MPAKLRFISRFSTPRKANVRVVASPTRPPARRVRDIRGAQNRVSEARVGLGSAAIKAEGRAKSRTQRRMARRSSVEFQGARRTFRRASANLLRLKAGVRSNLKKTRVSSPR